MGLVCFEAGAVRLLEFGKALPSLVEETIAHAWQELFGGDDEAMGAELERAVLAEELARLGRAVLGADGATTDDAQEALNTYASSVGLRGKWRPEL